MVEEMARPWLAHYEPGVPATLEVPSRWFHEIVQDTVGEFPDRTALIYYGARWSYARLWEESGRFAAAVYQDGVRPGDRVALYLPNCPAFPIAFLGTLRLGATVVQVSPLYLGQDLVGLLKDAGPKAIVTLEILHPHLAQVRGEVSVPLEYVARLREFYPAARRPFVNLVLRRRKFPTAFPTGPSIRPWRAALRAWGEFPGPSGDPAKTVAVLQYTGGTTGLPKAAMLSHRNILANALQCAAWFHNPRGSATVLASIPLFHIYGLTVAMNFPLVHGGTIVLQTRPDPSEILRLIDRYHPSEFPGVPALYQAINRHPKVGRYDIRSIRTCLSGSAPLPLEVSKRFEELTGGRLLEGYGLSEASPVTHANPLEGERRVGTIGLPFPSTDHRVVDLETGSRSLATGEVGELAVRGPQVMLGYYGRPEETAAVLRDGWLLTGDIASIDADGYATIVDRKKDLIVVGGFKVYPREVEEVLLQHPSVTDAAVVGVPDDHLGEVAKAFVVVRPGTDPSEAELREFVRARIAHYKAPRTIEFRPTLPRSGIQKVLRRVLREGAPPVATGPG